VFVEIDVFNDVPTEIVPSVCGSSTYSMNSIGESIIAWPPDTAALERFKRNGSEQLTPSWSF